MYEPCSEPGDSRRSLSACTSSSRRNFFKNSQPPRRSSRAIRGISLARSSFERKWDVIISRTIVWDSSGKEKLSAIDWTLYSMGRPELNFLACEIASSETSMPIPFILKFWTRYSTLRPLPQPRSRTDARGFKYFLPYSRSSQRVNLTRSSAGSVERAKCPPCLYSLFQNREPLFFISSS